MGVCHFAIRLSPLWCKGLAGSSPEIPAIFHRVDCQQNYKKNILSTTGGHKKRRLFFSNRRISHIEEKITFLHLARFKSVFQMPYAPRSLRGCVNFRYVEAAGRGFSLSRLVHHVPHRRAGDPALLFPAHRRRGLSVSSASPRLYLDERKRPSVPRDQVDFPHRRPKLPFENRVPFLFEVRGGDFLAPIANPFRIHGIGLFLAPAFVSMR